MFLTEQFRLLQQRLEDAIPTAKRAFLQQFYSQVYNITYSISVDNISGYLPLEMIT